MKNFLLVCEGQTDYFVIDAMTKKLSQQHGKDIKITPLAPQLDATTNQWPSHGWCAVRNWCKLYGEKRASDVMAVEPQLRPQILRKNWRAILAMANAEGIIIQIDTDIAEQIIDGQPFNPNIDHRKDYVEKSTLAWLNTKTKPNELYLALTTHALEAWILACHAPNEAVFSDLSIPFNYEDIPDLEKRLINLGYRSKRINGSTRLSKKEALYKVYASKVADNLTTVRSRCPSANHLCSHLENA